MASSDIFDQNETTSTLWHALTQWIRLPELNSRIDRQDRDLLRDIKRLTELSPHLLIDLGFTETINDHSTGLRVWERGDLVVTRHGPIRGAAYTIAVSRKQA